MNEEIRWVKITEALSLPVKDKAETLARVLTPYAKLLPLEKAALKQVRDLVSTYNRFGHLLTEGALRDTIYAVVMNA